MMPIQAEYFCSTRKNWNQHQTAKNDKRDADSGVIEAAIALFAASKIFWNARRISAYGP